MADDVVQSDEDEETPAATALALAAGAERHNGVRSGIIFQSENTNRIPTYDRHGTHILGHDTSLLDRSEEELSSDYEVIISCTSRNVHNLRPKKKSTLNEFTESHEVNIYRIETELKKDEAFILKRTPNNQKQVLPPNQTNNQSKTIEALNSEIERYLTKLKALKTVQAELAKVENSDDEYTKPNK